MIWYSCKRERRRREIWNQLQANIDFGLAFFSIVRHITFTYYFPMDTYKRSESAFARASHNEGEYGI